MSENDPVEIPVPAKRPERPKGTSQLVGAWRDRRLLVILVLILIATNAIVPIALVSLLYRTQIVLVADEAGNLVIGPGVDFSDANKVHTTSAILATKALLDRNPTGFDMPELVENLYFNKSLKQAQEEVKAALPDLKLKSVHQKAEVAKVEVVSVRQAGKLQIYYINVSGQIVRSGRVAGTAIREVDNFRIQLECWRNPRLNENGRYPLVVAGYSYLQLEPSNPNARRVAAETTSTPPAQQ
jgi:hypothetical protein